MGKGIKMAINYSDRIPNNVNLSSDRSLQRALEHWQPRFLDWWSEMGPGAYSGNDAYLRTAVGVNAKDWASYGYVKMPDYRWGIFLADPVENRTIGFGDNYGKPVWQKVPGELRTQFRRIIVTQGDTEPASVEQQRLLGLTCPSLYDLRNLFQVNVEEGRHLWAMVYLLHAYFGRDGREEAEELLERHSGDLDNPRILGTFNQPISDWLSFFMFTYFTDRDGKFQLKSLAESAFDPLSRTCRFMLTEEAHHMFVGETGLSRVIKRTLQVMKQIRTDDPDAIRAEGAIDLQTFQRYLNFWYSSSLDLFGAEESSNAAFSFANGIKGRSDEAQYRDHLEVNSVLKVDSHQGIKEIPTRNAMNEVLRTSYTQDCSVGLKRWNRLIARSDIDFEIYLPSAKFNRNIGFWREIDTDPKGNEVSRNLFDKNQAEWLPSQSDHNFIGHLMQRVVKPGKIAGWLAPPERGIDNKGLEYEYVRTQ